MCCVCAYRDDTNLENFGVWGHKLDVHGHFDDQKCSVAALKLNVLSDFILDQPLRATGHAVGQRNHYLHFLSRKIDLFENLILLDKINFETTLNHKRNRSSIIWWFTMLLNIPNMVLVHFEFTQCVVYADFEKIQNFRNFGTTVKIHLKEKTQNFQIASYGAKIWT